MSAMRFAFHVERGKYLSSAVTEVELDGHAEAWRVGLDMCVDLARGIADSLTPTEPEWIIAIKNDDGKAVFRFRVSGEIVPPS